MSLCVDRGTDTRTKENRYEDLAAYCREMFRSLPRSDQRRAGEVYVSGLLQHPGKKSIRRIASESAEGYSDQSLQQFVNQSGWDPAPVRQRLATWVSARSTPLAWVVDEVAFRKHGRHSVGVERQYVRSLGRLSNCQLGVFVALATLDAAVPVTWRLVIPRSWDADNLRRRKARIPHDERHQPYWRYQLEALDDLSGDWGVPLAPVVLDLRQSTSFTELVHELDDRGLEFLIQVNETMPICYHSARPRPTVHPADGRVSKHPGCSRLDDLSAALSALPRKTLSWRDPKTNLQVRAQFTRSSVHTVLPERGPGRTSPIPQVLLSEWGLGKPKPRAFWLSNMVDHALEDLVALTRLPRRADVDISTMIDRLGLCDYEGRSFVGWHHHTTLVSVAYAFHLGSQVTAQICTRTLRLTDPTHAAHRWYEGATAMSAAKRVTEEFLEQQVSLLGAGDTAGLAERYAPDAMFVRFDRIAVGREQIKKLFDDYLKQQPNISAIDALQTTDDVIFYQAAETLDGSLATAVGTLVFRDGLVWRQTVSFVTHRPA